jgi:hypothetical protein
MKKPFEKSVIAWLLLHLYKTTYKWQATICAHADLRLVGINEYFGMT